uniref:Catenin delta-1 n=1 Tax=Lygus hesperus TaxID=30085 RepID=A0A0A9WS18_LYGHE
MSTPRSKFVSDNLAKVRPKLPLYTNKKSDRKAQSKNVTMDDIMRSVKTLDDTYNVKKVERSVSFSQSGDLKKFQPCSSLADASETNPGHAESCVLDEFCLWESGAESNDSKTPTKSINNDESNDAVQKSPILVNTSTLKTSSKPVVSSAEDRLCSSQNVVSFKSLLSSQILLQTSQNNLVSDGNEESVNHNSFSKERDKNELTKPFLVVI